MKLALLVVVGVGAAAVFAVQFISTSIGNALDNLDMQWQEW